jgi:hypothetical protein
LDLRAAGRGIATNLLPWRWLAVAVRVRVHLGSRDSSADCADAHEKRGDTELLRLEKAHELLALRGLPDGQPCDERTCGVHSVHHCGTHD